MSQPAWKDGRRRIYLMRHGAVSYLLPDGRRVADTDAVDLTADGIEQARAMGRVLAEVPLDRAACTGLPRTRQTAEHALEGRGLEVEVIAPLREIRPGRIDDLAEHRIEPDYVYAMERAAEPGMTFGGGEAFAGFYDRVTATFERLVVAPGDWHRMLLVAHGGTNRALLAWTTRAGLDGLATFEQDLGCLNVLDFDVHDGRIVRRYLRQLNMTPRSLSKHGLVLTSLETMVAQRARLRAAAAALREADTEATLR